MLPYADLVPRDPVPGALDRYALETQLARRLREASPAARQELYQSVYKEYFHHFPPDPQSRESREARARNTGMLLRQVAGAGDRVLEIGAGQGDLARWLAPFVGHVTAMDVVDVRPQGEVWPENITFQLTSGTSLPVADASFDVIFCNQVMEHIHPDDALHYLQSIHAALKPGGRFVNIVPHRLDGPHDVSREHDRIAAGFHLKEYFNHELVNIYKSIGFSSCYAFVGGGGRFRKVPVMVPLLAEKVMQSVPLPWKVKRDLCHRKLVRGIIGIRLVAVK